MSDSPKTPKDERDIEEQIELRSAPPAEPTWTTAEEYAVPRREPRSDVFVLQRWVTIAGKQGSLIAQDESTYLDFSDYQDAAVFVEVGAYASDQAIAIETRPRALRRLDNPLPNPNDLRRRHDRIQIPLAGQGTLHVNAGAACFKSTRPRVEGRAPADPVGMERLTSALVPN